MFILTGNIDLQLLPDPILMPGHHQALAVPKVEANAQGCGENAGRGIGKKWRQPLLKCVS